jgi:hypothetical protein
MHCAILYCHMWAARLYNVFVKYAINGTIFGKGGGGAGGRC